MAYIRTILQSQTLLLNEQSRKLETEGQTIYKFGFGQSPFAPLPRVVSALQQNAAQKDYTPVQGIPELREAIASFHNKAEGLKIKSENILVAPGSKTLIYSVLAAFTQADVLIPAPAWVSYAPQAHLIGHQTISVPTSYEARWRIAPETLEQLLAQREDKKRPAILILNYPGNPEGLTYTKAELTALAEVLRKHQVLVISDEIYGLLHHTGGHYSIMHAYPENTVITTGLSKWSGAGGWRIGALLLSDETGKRLREQLIAIGSETYSCAATPIQKAACVAYDYDAVTQEYIANQRLILSALGNWCQQTLAKSGIAVHPPEGGFYLFVDFSRFQLKLAAQKIKTSPELCTYLLKEAGVALLPGTAFGMEPTSLTARLAYVEFDGMRALEYIQKHKLKTIDHETLQTLAPKTLAGITALCAPFAK